MVSERVIVSPNPAAEYIFVTNETQSETLTLEVYDLSGIKRISVESNEVVYEVNTGVLSSGIYLLVINGNTGYRDVKKLVLP